jgi:hypothetical protein
VRRTSLFKQSIHDIGELQPLTHCGLTPPMGRFEPATFVVCSRMDLHTHFRCTHTPVPYRPTGVRTVAFLRRSRVRTSPWAGLDHTFTSTMSWPRRHWCMSTMEMYGVRNRTLMNFSFHLSFDPPFFLFHRFFVRTVFLFHLFFVSPFFCFTVFLYVPVFSVSPFFCTHGFF